MSDDELEEPEQQPEPETQPKVETITMLPDLGHVERRSADPPLTFERH